MALTGFAIRVLLPREPREPVEPVRRGDYFD